MRFVHVTDVLSCVLFFFQAEDGIRDGHVTGVQTCALPISASPGWSASRIPEAAALLDVGVEEEAEGGQLDGAESAGGGRAGPRQRQEPEHPQVQKAHGAATAPLPSSRTPRPPGST